MTTGTMRLQGRPLEVDGEALVVWTEARHDRFSAVARDHDGHEIGSAAATRVAGHSSTAELALRTCQEFRRRGLGRELLGTLIGWAEQEGVEFLVGSAPAADVGVRGFLASSGRPVATRTAGSSAKFAIQAPPRPAVAAEDRDAVARALESGASFAEADALRRTTRTSESRHPVA